jgi:hypothetical protein
VWDSDSFEFEKLADDGNQCEVFNWNLYGWDGLAEDSEFIANQFEYINVYPNPFNPTTTIDYRLSLPCEVNLTIFDITGRKIAKLVDGFQSAGTHSITFGGTDLASGIYFAKLYTTNYTNVIKLLLIK